MRLQQFTIIRMNLSADASLPPLINPSAEVIKRNPIGVETFAVRPEYCNQLRCEIENLPKLCFLVPDTIFGSLALSDIRHGSFGLSRPVYRTGIALFAARKVGGPGIARLRRPAAAMFFTAIRD
jgi:hypothetical protein